jgi:hypothetical protein
MSKLDDFSCSSENMGFAKDSGTAIPKRQESTVCDQPPVRKSREGADAL